VASEARGGKNERRNYRPLNYFYLDGELDGKIVPLLHKKLRINLPADTITAWCYPLGKRVAYTYSDVKRRKGPAFTTVEAAKLINRSKIAVERAVHQGMVEAPQKTYGIDAKRNPYKFMWSEQDVIALHAYFLTVHYGRPRRDGIVVPKAMPSLRELRALMRNQELLYMKGEDGEFRPVWSAG
jgi:hypothetical protein